MGAKTIEYLYQVLCGMDRDLQIELLKSQVAGNQQAFANLSNMIALNNNAIYELVGTNGATLH